MGALGADEKSWWEAKAHWIDDYAPTILLGGTTTTDPSRWYDGAMLNRGLPTWNYLWDELARCDDIEIVIDSGSFRHALTLTAMSFDDPDGDRTWDSGENRWITYVDPNNPDGIKRINPPPDALPGPLLAQINDVLGLDGLPTGQLTFRWDNLGYNAATDVEITLAYTERIPEPTPAATLLALLTARALLHRPRRPYRPTAPPRLNSSAAASRTLALSSLAARSRSLATAASPPILPSP